MATEVAADGERTLDIGAMEIGSAPLTGYAFAQDDCGPEPRNYGDCFAIAGDGTHYVFFGGGISIVSLETPEAFDAARRRLPMQLRHGDPIDQVRTAFEREFGIKFTRVDRPNGSRILSTDFEIRTRRGLLTWLELEGDEHGRLLRVRQGTDF
ncbi:MAG: hypothetical protein IPO95_07500 [Rhodanobacteraceae bacterium]|nr:hypothetical protein [Rhodanobacteraceae bacterium]